MSLSLFLSSNYLIIYRQCYSNEDVKIRNEDKKDIGIKLQSYGEKVIINYGIVN